MIIPKSITSIGNAAFYNCNGLTSIISECSNPPTTSSTSFSNMVSTIPVYVPWGKVSNYQSASGWNVFTNYIEQFQFEQYDTDNWSDVNNWYTFEFPTANDVVCLNSNCKMNVNASVLYLYIVNPEHTLTIKSGKTLFTTYGIGLDNQSQLIIEGTGMVIYGNAPSYTIIASANPTEGGTVTGGGTYSLDESCTLTASANEGYSFTNWTEDGIEVSSESTYSFTVTGTRTLVANFEENVVVENIVFADANVKALCVANWDTNEDGELSYAEAAAVTDLGEVFKENYSIYHFDELQYFTGLTSIGYQAFAWCLYLSSIQLPNTITSIGNSAFFDCRNLQAITIPASVTNIGSSALVCENFEEIIVEAGNTVYDSRDNCNAVIKTGTNTLIRGCKNTVIPNTVVSLGSGAFQSCTMESLFIPASITNIYYDAFYACEYLAEITVSEDNPVYDSRDNCNAIIKTATNELVVGSRTTVIPNSVTSIGTYAFSYRFRWGSYDIIIPELVTSIGNNAYIGGYAVNSLTVLAEVPPTLGSGAFKYVPKGIPVYIPCGTLADYQAASGWSEFTNYHEIATGVTQTIELGEGWNWFSTYIEAEDPVELLQMLEAALGENASQISSAELFTENDGGDWWGDLDEEGVTNEQMYMILVETPCTIELEGVPANAADHAITINPGWNWIGFPCDHEMTIEEALGGFDAEEGDVFANSEFFTEFDGEWFGDVETLLPGQGFMYFSNSEETKTLIIGGGKFVPLQPK